MIEIMKLLFCKKIILSFEAENLFPLVQKGNKLLNIKAESFVLCSEELSSIDTALQKMEF